MTKLSLTAATAPVKPTKIFKTCCKKIKVYLFGAPNDFGPQGNSAIITETLKFYAGINGVKNIFAPSCKKFNAEIIHTEKLRHKTRLRGGQMFHRGYFADGVILTAKGDAFFISSADCPTIVAIGKNIAIIAHAGLGCLIDKDKIYNNKPSRKHESVVDSVMEKFIKTRENIDEIQIFITCGIKGANYSYPSYHPQYGNKNKILINYLLRKYSYSLLGDYSNGLISLDNLIKNQFVLYGVWPKNVILDNIDTYDDKNSSGEYIWHSCARGRTPEEKKRRNGVLVIRNF